MENELYIINAPKPYDGCICYVSMFISPLYDRKDDKVLVDGPAGFGSLPREKVWVPSSWVGLKV